MSVRVVPAVPTFSVDGGFRYSVPERLQDRIVVGSLVRVPLGGRRVAGYVTAFESHQGEGLRDVAAISGKTHLFDVDLLDVCRGLARHYVAPLSVLLGRTAPPNVPPAAGRPPSDPVPEGPEHPLRAHVGEALRKGSSRASVWLDASSPESWVGPVAAEVLVEGRSMLVVVPTTEEASDLAGRLGRFGDRLVSVTGDDDDSTVTAAWAQAAHHGGLVIGTPRVALWRIADLAVVGVVEESRRAMKDRQTPTVHVREVVAARALRSRLVTVFGGPSPSVELMSRGPTVLRPPARIWPLVEVVDRREDPLASGLLAERTKQAIRVAVGRGQRVLLFAHRRGYSAASRCVACRRLRRCASCGSSPDPEPSCRRCGTPLGPCTGCGGARFEPLGAGVGRVIADVGRVVDRSLVAQLPETAQVTVGTERDLAAMDRCDLAVLVDADGLMFGANYRAAEETLRIGARLAGLVEPGSGRRLIVQTQDPDHPVIVALRRADPEAFVDSEMEARRELGYPPSGALIVIEARGDGTGPMDEEIRVHAGQAMVLGPAESANGTRWLVQGRDLDGLRVALRGLAQRWRDSGLTIRIDADPIDL